jgi:intracellular septation protein
MSDNLTPDNPDGAAATAAPSHPAWLPFLIDFGPLLAFFLTYKFSGGDGQFAATAGAVKGTAVFMVAIVIALIVSQWKLKKISPMLWLSAILVIGFGGLTLYFHDEKFIQIKPTIIYAGFAMLLLGGWMRGKALLKILLQAAYDGMSDTGWLLLSRNWGFFFVAMALLNEALRATLPFGSWLTVKVWGGTIFTFLFMMSQMPLMLRHGLAISGAEPGEPTES